MPTSYETDKIDTMVELDALIVGAGFGGVYQLKKLRDNGFNVKLVESGSDFGGVWYWNRYPGARVDIPTPHYEFSDPDLWTDWNWKQRFPGSEEIRTYFQYVAGKWDLKKDSIFNTYVVSAVWDEDETKWTISTNTGTTFRSRFFLPCTGFAAKRYIPDWKGIESFKGTFVHPSYWPKDELDLQGKKIAVIGTGSTGVQLSQALAPLASQFTLFQRTPNLAMPMKQIEFEGKETAVPKAEYPALYEGRKDSFGAIDFNFMPIRTFDHSPQEREDSYEKLWAEGDFHFWLATYSDTLFDDSANTEAYNFWRDKVRARLSDSRLKDKLAPMLKPHAFGCKRASLENGFYELFNQPKVRLIDTNDTPVVEFTDNGIRTTVEELEFDYIVCATGFDSVTGGILQMNVIGKNGITLEEKWSDGVKTYLGLSVSGFPNMFITYGPQAPTAFCNGPSCAELQGDWIVTLLDNMREKELGVVDATPEAEHKWAEGVQTIANMSLLPTTKSWYGNSWVERPRENVLATSSLTFLAVHTSSCLRHSLTILYIAFRYMGDNVPGKKHECLIYLGGVPTYYKTIQACAASDYDGFQLH